MTVYSDLLKVETELGRIEAVFSVTAPDLARNQISFCAIPFDPKLPADMRVRKCTAVLLAIDGLVLLEEVSLSLKLITTTVGAACTGQCLDAQEWSENGNLVVIGTEDGEALSCRYPGLGLEDQVTTELSDRSMILRLRKLGLHNCPSFHFVVAENDDPEPIDASAWFAVDQNHDFVLQQQYLPRARS
ncbi:MAG: hypothetical protein AAF709_14635 [Pseudomonadota bacterium]